MSSSTGRPSTGKPPSAGSWKPGQSGNPGGRAKGAVALAREKIAAETRNGDELIEILLSIARRSEKDSDRVKACVELQDRYLGKAQQSIEITAAPPPALDFAPLTDAELAALTRLDVASLPAASDTEQ